ncbi:MAG: hypothetical protein KKD55_04885, partial [Candidatus Omnitrophica bacterium]|nr:hypothetical protein [Candidatus Omnitrophota bacterium]
MVNHLKREITGNSEKRKPTSYCASVLLYNAKIKITNQLPRSKLRGIECLSQITFSQQAAGNEPPMIQKFEKI